MTQNGVIQRKLEVIAERVARLRGRGPVDVRQLEQDFFFKSGVERTLQVCIEAMTDVANRIICLENRPASTDSHGSFRQLQELGIIETAERYRKMIQFRNLVVHRYEQIDNEILVVILADHLGDFDSFIREIEDHE